MPAKQETLGDVIRRLRTKAKLTLMVLAYKAETSPSHISAIELGKIHPTGKTLAKISSVIGPIEIPGPPKLERKAAKRKKRR